jgi:hypothetical protein
MIVAMKDRSISRPPSLPFRSVIDRATTNADDFCNPRYRQRRLFIESPRKFERRFWFRKRTAGCIAVTITTASLKLIDPDEFPRAFRPAAIPAAARPLGQPSKDDDGPALPARAVKAVTKEDALKQIDHLLTSDVWERLDSATRNDLIVAEMAWLETANLLFKWPIEESPHQATCAHCLCRAFERQLRAALRRVFEEANIHWRGIFRSKAPPNLGQMARLFSPPTILTQHEQINFERTTLYRTFSSPSGVTLSDVIRIRNRAAHGNDSSQDRITPADVIAIRDFVFVKGALAAAANS